MAPPEGSVGFGAEPAASWPKPGPLQKRLIEANYLRAQYRTGYYGSRTTKAVKALQKDYRLKRTGRMSKSSDRALTKAVARMTRPRTWYHSEVIGRSQSNRKIRAYRAGEPGKPVVVVMATMHVEETSASTWRTGCWRAGRSRASTCGCCRWSTLTVWPRTDAG